MNSSNLQLQKLKEAVSIEVVTYVTVADQKTRIVMSLAFGHAIKVWRTDTLTEYPCCYCIITSAKILSNIGFTCICSGNFCNFVFPKNILQYQLLQ